MTYYGPRFWFPCSHSIFQIFCFSIRFVFVSVFIYFSNICLSIYIVLVLLFVLVLVLVTVTLLHFDSVLVLVIVTKISLSTALYTSLWWRWRRCRPIQRRWNEFKSGRHMSGAKRRKFVWSCPSKVWALPPCPGWSVTFVLQFHTRKNKTAIQSECIASQGLFFHCLRSKLRTEWYF